MDDLPQLALHGVDHRLDHSILPPPCGRCAVRSEWSISSAVTSRHAVNADLETCEHCGGRTKGDRAPQDPEGIARFLRHLGEPTEPPPLSPASAPPYFQSRVFRRRRADQGELFDW